MTKLNLNDLVEYEEGRLILSPKEAAEVEQLLEQIKVTLQPAFEQLAGAWEHLLADTLFSLCWKGMKGDAQAIEELVKLCWLSNFHYLSFDERGQLKNLLNRDEITGQTYAHAIAMSAVAIWLGDKSPSDRIVYFRELTLKQLLSIPDEKRPRLLTKEIKKVCRRELLTEALEHPTSKKVPVSITEGSYGPYVSYFDEETGKQIDILFSTELGDPQLTYSDESLCDMLESHGINPEKLTSQQWQTLYQLDKIIRETGSIRGAHQILSPREYNTFKQRLHRFKKKNIL